MPVSSSVLARLFAVLAIVGALALPGLAAPAPAVAEAPLRLGSQVTDLVGVLDNDQKAEVQAAIDDLHSEHKVQLWVVYVADFDGMDPRDWAAATVEKSGPFTDRDIVMAVATVDHAFALDVPSGLHGLSENELESLYDDTIRPDLRDEDWSGAAIAAAGGIADNLTPEDSNSGTYIAVGGAVVVAGGGGAYLYTRRRRKHKLAAEIEAARTIDPADLDALAALPLPVLDARSKEVLVETDNAIRTSSEELELARGEFGDSDTQRFTTALADAKNVLAEAFTIRQKLDDTFPESPEEQRALLVKLVSSCGRADHDLDALVDEFDAMRDLLINAPERLDALTRDVVDLTARIPASTTTLTQLTAEFPAPALEPVATNVTMAQERIAFAEKNIADGRAAVALPAGKQGPAVAAIRSAEGALNQARVLLDALDRAAGDIRNAIANLPAALADARADINAATGLVEHGGQPLRDAQAAADAAVQRAEQIKDANPLGAYTEIATADIALDKAIAEAALLKQNAERLAAQVEQAITAAQAQVAAATDYVATRRGAVGAEPRTRLSEAQRHLDEAQRVRETDPSQALTHAQAAADLADRALRAAQSDVAGWEASQNNSSGSNTGAVLGGILVEGLIRGAIAGAASSGRRSGGYRRSGSDRGGSSGPGSFGGSSRSGRIGMGGRF